MNGCRFRKCTERQAQRTSSSTFVVRFTVTLSRPDCESSNPTNLPTPVTRSYSLILKRPLPCFSSGSRKPRFSWLYPWHDTPRNLWIRSADCLKLCWIHVSRVVFSSTSRKRPKTVSKFAERSILLCSCLKRDNEQSSKDNKRFYSRVLFVQLQDRNTSGSRLKMWHQFSQRWVRLPRNTKTCRCYSIKELFITLQVWPRGSSF